MKNLNILEEKILYQQNKIDSLSLECKASDLSIIKKEKQKVSLKNEVSDLEENIPDGFFLYLLELISFGIYNKKERYLELLNTKKTLYQEILKTLESEYIQFDELNKELKKNTLELESLKNDFYRQLDEFKATLIKFQNELLDYSKNIYINYNKMQKKLKLIQDIIPQCNQKYIYHNRIKSHINELINFIEEPMLWVENSNIRFVKDEKVSQYNYFQEVEDNALTNSQQDAVLINENNNLVIAGAGSGKTSVIVAKVGYLVNKGYATLDEILVLAFNSDAVDEIQDRIKTKLGFSAKVKTFHSFGYEIIGKSDVKPSLCKWAADEMEFSKLLKDMLLSKMKEPKFYENIKYYFLEHLIPYKNEFDFENYGEYYNYIRNYEMRTLNGELVKSYEECEIANFLRLKNITYEYETRYKYDTATSKKRQYEPDFYLPDYEIYIEHFGISRDYKTAPYVNNEEYVDGMKWKINLHSENDTILIQTFSYEKSEGNLTKNLEKKLREHNVQMKDISFEEALEVFNKKHGVIDGFTKLVKTFLGHYKGNQFTINDILQRVDKNDFRTKAFLNIFSEIYESYQEICKEKKCIDFHDMIIQGIDLIRDRKYNRFYKYILIDEFQDISIGRSNLIKEVSKLYDDTVLTVVGDDWQSIYRFTGSEISIIKKFSDNFGISKKVFLDDTFRFDNNISKVASNFIMKNESQIEKNIQTLKHVDKPSIYVYQVEQQHDNNILAILNLLYKNNTGNEKKSIVILARFNHQRPENLLELQKQYTMFDIKFMTVHTSKGLGADYIIVTGLESGKFGFPCEIEDDPIIDKVMSTEENFLHAEERRLFYVALTRVKEKIFLISSARKPSSFVEEILKDNSNKEIHEMGLLSDSLTHCPRCELGSLVRKETEEYGAFYNCSNFPLCNYNENILECDVCNKELIRDYENYIAVCEDGCDSSVKLCQECSGHMLVRSGPYGDFLGCSNYSPEFGGCEFKSKIS